MRDKKEAQIVTLSSVETDEDERMMTEMAELDRVLEEESYRISDGRRRSWNREIYASSAELARGWLL